MPRTAVPTQAATRNTNTVVTLNSADQPNGNSVANDGRAIILLQNPTGGTIIATVASVPDAAGRTGDIVRSILAGEYDFIGPLKPADWNQSDGTVSVSWNVTGAKIGVVIPPSL